MISRIVSGGQTGADRAALEFAIEHNISHGGWCPKGRRAEAGPIDPRYNLMETPSANYEQRTEWNVRDSEATVIFTLSPELSGGSKKTEDFAKKHAKKCLHLHAKLETPAVFLTKFVEYHKVQVLNVAGTRGSKEPTVGQFVKRVLEEAFYGKPVD
ncbi:MAG: putative molybdenum carrier protein [Verrucomicrobiia bacterium]